MTNTLAHPGPFDPLERADPDQPFFPLMAGDQFAPALVEEWADRTRRYARNVDNTDERTRLLAKCNEAEEIAWSMRTWAKTGRPDEVKATGGRATYSGEKSETNHEWHESLSEAVESLREAAYYMGEARDGLLKLDLLTEEECQALESAMSTVNRMANEREPKRRSYALQPKLPIEDDA